MARAFVVAVYLEDRSYGGPEEGGWWFDCGQLVRVQRVFRTEDAAIAFSRKLNDKLDRTLNRDRRDIGSVLSEGVYRASIWEEYAPKHFPQERPYYS